MRNNEKSVIFCLKSYTFIAFNEEYTMAFLYLKT